MRRGAATLVIAAGLIGGCVPPAPTTSLAPSPSTSASVAAVPTPTVVPTPDPTATAEPTPEPTPEPFLEQMGIEAFTPIASGSWELAMSADNIDDGNGQITNWRPMTAFAEIFIQCAGSGQLSVQVTAGVPQNHPDAASATPAPLGAATLDCPNPAGLIISLAGTAPDGWFASPDIEVSNPSIVYQVLVGTIVD